MQKNVLYYLLIISMLACIFSSPAQAKPFGAFYPAEKKIQVLVITGGSKAYTEAFTDIFRSMEGITFDILSQPEANEALLADSIKKYNALVFYDMTQPISPEQKAAFLEMTNRGTGLVFLHHSLVSYQDWDEFKRIIGGKYYDKKAGYPPERISVYKHDLILDVKVMNPKHPVNKGIKDFSIQDEGYNNIEMLPTVTPLLSVNHPDCTDIVAWTNEYNHSKVVYILLGHDDHAFHNQSYRRLISNAIRWSRLK